MLFPNEIQSDLPNNKAQLLDLIKNNIGNIYKSSVDKKLLSKQTKKSSEIKKDFYETYQKELDTATKYEHQIISFEQIGWSDPYPRENKKVQKFKIDDVSSLKGNGNWK
jgi:hypothetical protein